MNDTPRCPGTGQPVALKIQPAHVTALCGACNKAFPDLGDKVGSVAPDHALPIINDTTHPGSRMFGVPTAMLWRAHVSPAESYGGTEVTAFVRAGSHGAAVTKIAGALAVIETRNPEHVQQRIYNCNNAVDLIADGLSDDHEQRIFETGWSDRVLCWVESPLVLLTHPAPLLRAWARLPPTSTP